MKLLRFIGLFPLAALAASASNDRLDGAVAALTLSSGSEAAEECAVGGVRADAATPRPGETKLGYTYFRAPDVARWHPNDPGRSGWFRVVESGEVGVWCDQNGDRQQQPEEVMIVSSRLWFTHRSRVEVAPVAVDHESAKSKADGAAATEAVAGLGDRAWFVATGQGTETWFELVVVRGDVTVRFEGQPVVTVCAGPEFADDPILRSVGGGALVGDLREYALPPDAPSGYVDVAEQAPRIEALLRSELVAMARTFVAKLDRLGVETAARTGATVAQGPREL